MKKILIVIGGVIVIAVLAYLAARRLPQNTVLNYNGQIKVVASFYPLAYFAKQVGGSHVNVINITPSGGEPHDYEPTPQQIADIHTAEIFIVNGGGVDAWADRIIPELQSQRILVVKMADHFPLSLDPHFWLDPALAEQEVEIIRTALINSDPQDTADYQKNSDNYLAHLRALDQDYRQGLAQCQNRDVVTSHAAFGYLAKRYNLNQIAIAGLSPDSEPSTQGMTEIAQLAKQKQIKVIFFETLLSPKLAETIAREIGAQTAVLNPLEGLTDNEIRQGKTYISVMADNLNNLRIALQCK